ncbi:YhdP family protein [Crenothrix sp.]|uniref:YhdP family protein n=1 Tax=Crenothrix sp. TaxID=3100433 RepID=UPI00374CF733
MIHHIKRATRHLIFWSLITITFALSGVRLLLYGIERYKTDLEQHVSELIGTPVSIGRLGTRIRGFSPEIVIKDISVLSAKKNEKPPIQLEQIRLGVDLLEVLATQQLLSSSWVTLVGAKLSVKRKPDGSFALMGLKANNDDQPLWLLQGHKYELLQSQITWQDEKRQGKPIIFDAVDLVIMNEGDRHRLNMLANMPKKYGELLRVSADFTGNVFQPDSIHGSVFIEGKHLKLAKLVTGDLPLSVHIDSGIGDFNVWTQVENSQLSAIQGDVQFQEVKLRRTGRSDFAAKTLKTQFYWGVKEDQWRLTADDLLVQQDNQNAKSTLVLGVAGTYKAGVMQKVALFSKRLDLPIISKAVLFFAPLTAAQNQQLTQAAIKGHLENFSLSVNLLSNTQTLNGAFTNVSLSGGNAAAMGVENLSGTVKGTDKQGSVHLATENGRFIAPQLFRNPLSLYKLTGTLDWQQTNTQWLLSSLLLELNAPVISSKSRLFVALPKGDEPAFLDLQSEFVGDDISKVTQYLPVGIMKKTVVEWLDKAFVKGKVSKGGFLFYGKPTDFPFKDGQGVFETLFDVDQTTLSYHPQWPVVTDINAEVLFLQNSLQVTLRQGQTQQMKINHAKISIPELGASPHLLIEGGLESEIANALHFMQKTPFHSGVDAVLKAITPVGNAQIGLDLKIPLREDAMAKVQGVAQVNDAKLTVKSIDLPVTHLKGALKFNERGVYSDTIQADALHYPIKINIDQASQKTVINVAGRAAIDDLKQQFPSAWWDKFSGASDYSLKLDLPVDTRAPELNLQSDLVGIAVDMPDTLVKATDQKKPLSLTFDFDDSSLLPVVLNYDDQLKIALKVDVIKKTLESAQILVGLGNVAQPKVPGIAVDINRDRLVLQDWLALAAAQSVNGEHKAADAGINVLKIHSAHGIWKDTDLGVFDISLKPEASHWSGTLNSEVAKGQLRVPYQLRGTEKISFNMDMLDFSLLKQANLTHKEAEKITFQPDPDTVPEIMPLLAISSKKTLWDGFDLGQLNVETERKFDGIVFKRLELASKDHKMLATGRWKITGKQSETVLKGHWDLPKAGAFFNQVGLTKDFTETQAKVDFALNWKAAPQQFALAKLNGQMDIHFNQGRILSIEPGFGRVLGVLALAQWIKRLQLDFSDVFQDGLTYNRIDGHFDIVNGKAVTKNLVIDAIPATITLTGEADLVKKTVDYTVNVVPNSADALPIAGTIVGRLTSIVAKTLTGKNQDGFLFGSQYQIKGEWGNAKISQLHKDEGLLQKTWHGLTDFSWLKN